MELSSAKFKKLHISLERTCKAHKTNKKSALKKFFVSCDVFAVKDQFFLSLPLIIAMDLYYLNSKDLQ